MSMLRTWALVGNMPDVAHVHYAPTRHDLIFAAELERLEREQRRYTFRPMLTRSSDEAGQIEHHLFPDMPSNRYAEVAPRVRGLCRRFGLPYNTGRMSRQVGTTMRKIWRYSLPGGEDTVSQAPAIAEAPQAA